MKKILLKNNVLSFSFLVFLLGAFNVSHAQLNTWVGGTSSDFLDAANWSTAAPPATFLSGNTFTIGAGTPNNPVLSANYPLTSGAPTSGLIYISTVGNLTTSGNINAGGVNSVDGLLTVTGGIFNGRSNFYIGTTPGSVVAVTNVEVGGTLNVKSALLISQKQAGTLNVNGGSVTTDSAGSIAVGNYPAYVDCNGILNVNAGLVKTAGALTIGTKGIVNVDAGRIELGTDRTVAIGNYITNNVLKVSGAALAAGKILLNKYDSVTLLTTVMAVLPGTEPSALDYTTTAGSYTVGTAIADNPKSALTLGTGATATYTVSPALPAGLALNPTTGTISGTPTAVKALTTYYVKASTDYGFTTKAITIVVAAAPLGISEFKESAKIAVYPNPTTDFVTVSLSDNATVQKISVYNNLGQLVRTEEKNTVSFQNLAKGNYYLTIQTEKGSFSKKVIKN